MLKYTINRNKLSADRKQVDLDKVVMTEIPTDSNDKNMLVCYYSNGKEYNFKEGQILNIDYRVDVSNDNGVSTKSLTFTTECELLKVNNEKGVFATVVDRYYNLDISSLTEVEEDEILWHFYFPDGHLFDRDSNDSGIETVPTVLYIEYQYTEDGVLMNGLAEILCNYVNPNQLSCVYDETEMGKLRSSVFSDNSDTATLSGIRIYRQTPLFRQTNNIFIYIDSTLCNINIPLSINFATNMYQSDALNDNFVADERNRAINRVVDMEKDVYHPVIWDSENENYVTGIDKEIDKIVFNLHFRQHRGDDWLVEPDTYWNGCYIDENNKVRLIGRGNEENTYQDVDYFSYSNDNESKQSDLLTYLNFTNDDVRYQKNKLARSFIRIMFYDSMNPANQNLLYYSTVFLDAGTLFGKYIKHIEETPYRTVIYETDETTGKEIINIEESIKDLIGIKVNREPCGDLAKDKTDDEIEELRLSCQLSVQDKYQSNGSSDGFYLYLWKDNEIGVTPVDLYVKVEFNHAGYGRTIPMMMPFWDKNKKYADGEMKIGIKSFQDILDDWNSEKDENDIWRDENGNVTDGQYGARQYMKYSYIHFKCKYDKKHKQHIYYLDDEYYGTDIKDGGVHFKDNIITLNLYEAKMV